DEVIYAISVTGWGMFAAANRTAEKLRFFRGSRYNLAALWHILFKQTYPATLNYESAEETGEFITIFVSNTMHTGKGIKAAPKAKVDDGLMDVVMIRDENRLRLLRLFKQFLTGQYLTHKQVAYQQVSTFKLQTNSRQTLNIDGEMKGSSPFSVRVIPKAIELLL
ncbi:MAG: diacylglycerol/lipid kinase family protein, partial [Planctomycetota bacterium]